MDNQMEFAEKMAELESIVLELRELQVPFAEISAEYSRMRAQINVLKERKSAIQSALKYEAFI